MSVTSCCSACFVLFYVLFNGKFWHSAFKLDLSPLFTTLSFQFILKFLPVTSRPPMLHMLTNALGYLIGAT